MKKIFIASLLLVGTLAHGEYRATIPGKTAAEREIRWLWKYLNEFVISCAGSSGDCRNPEVRSIANQLSNYLPAFDSLGASDWMSLLEFVSEKDRPDLFRSDLGEAHRVAVTENRKYAKVYINTDRMDLSLETWVGILAHEAAHHLGILDDAQRMPDQVGAAVQKHFSRRLQFSALEQFKAPGLRTATFNSEAEFRLSVGFFAWPNQLSDMNWGPIPTAQVCEVYEAVKRQYVSAPMWRVNRFRVQKGVVSIRGGGSVRMECFNRTTGKTRTNVMPLQANVELQYKAPLDLDNWTSETPTVLLDQSEWTASPTPDDHKFGLAQTFLVLSTEHNKTQLKAGELWHVSLKTKSLDGFVPTGCQLFVSGTTYAFLKQDNLPGVNFFKNCNLKSLGSNVWQVDGDLTFPPETRPDSYYVPAVIFSDAVGDRFAIPTVPSFVKVENPAAVLAPVIRELKFIGVVPAQNLGTLPVTNSYLVNDEQEFTVQMQVEGTQTVSELWFDFDLWYPRTDEFGIGLGTGSAESVKQIGLLLEESIARNAQGSLVTMKFRMKKNLGPFMLSALKFRRIYMRSSDFSWVEIELPGQHDSMVINTNFGR